jgi:hypothetical protein
MTNEGKLQIKNIKWKFLCRDQEGFRPWFIHQICRTEIVTCCHLFLNVNKKKDDVIGFSIIREKIILNKLSNTLLKHVFDRKQITWNEVG